MVGRYYPDADLDMLRRAYIFSAREHKDQVRQSGEPYLIHPLSVAGILAEMKMDVATVSTGFLHDVVEDTLTTIDNIKTYFGEEIAHLVDGVTKISNLGKVSKEQQQAESLRKMVLAMVKDLRVVIVKLADRLHNMRTLDHLPAEKRRRIAQETLDVYAPIAHRLGMGKVRAELEDLSFKYLEPDAYKKLQDAIERRRSASDSFLEEVKTRISEYLGDAGIELVKIEGRIKRLYSIYLKMKRQKITLDQVYDLMAMRLIMKDMRIVMPRSVLSTSTGILSRAALRISSPRRAKISINRCTRPSLAMKGSHLKSKFAPKTCTALPKKALPRIGSTRKASSTIIAKMTRSNGSGIWSNGSRKSRIRANSWMG